MLKLMHLLPRCSAMTLKKDAAVRFPNVAGPPPAFLTRPPARVFWRNHAEIDAPVATLQRHDVERTPLSDDRMWPVRPPHS